MVDRSGAQAARASNVTSLSAQILDIVEREPDRTFVILDFVHITHTNAEAVRQALVRLVTKNKNSHKIMRVGRGLYRYNPLSEHPDLMALMKYGYWRVENVRFITKGARGDKITSVAYSDLNNSEDITQAKSLVDFPWVLPSGQKVEWCIYHNGTQEIRLSANKKAPFSPDHMLTLIHILEQRGFGGHEWECISIEVNVEGRNWTVPGSFTISLLQRLLLKVYQHGPCVRIELADRRSCSTKEVLTLLHAVANGFDGAEALNYVREFDSRLRRCEKLLKLPSFKRASELK